MRNSESALLGAFGTLIFATTVVFAASASAGNIEVRPKPAQWCDSVEVIATENGPVRVCVKNGKRVLTLPSTPSSPADKARDAMGRAKDAAGR